MKKLLSIILVLILSLSCFSLISCDKDELSAEQLAAYNAYTSALEKTNSFKCLDGKLDMDITMNVQGTTQSVSYKFNMKATDVKTPKTMKMRLDGTMNLAGQSIVMDCYMEDGWAYYDMTTLGQNMKFKTNLAGGNDEYSQMFNMGSVDLPKSLFKKITVAEKADGSKELSLTLSGAQLLELYPDFAASAGTDTKPSDISDASVTATVDANGYLAKTVITYGMVIQGIRANATLTVEYFNLGQDVTVEPIEGYQSFPEQSLS